MIINQGRFVLPQVVCPSDDLAQMAVRQEAALAMFRELCPEWAHVTNVYGIRGRGKCKCAWEVHYVHVNGYEHTVGKEMVRQIENVHPPNTSIINKVKMFPPPFLKVNYSVNCACLPSPNADKFKEGNMSFIKNIDSVEEIKNNLENLKVEDMVQE